MNTAKDVLAQKGDVFQISAEASVFDAACLMNKLAIGGLLVIDNPNIGIFTERDLLRRVVVKGRNPATTTLREVMTCPVITAPSETSVIDCLSLLASNHVRHLPVVDADGFCGILTNRDIDRFLDK